MDPRWSKAHRARFVWVALPVIIATLGCGQGAPRPGGLGSSGPQKQVRRSLPEPYEVEITASTQRWRVRYPDAAGRRGQGKEVATARIIRVPRNTDVLLILKSADYIYSLSIPAFGVKEIAVPELEFQLRVRPTRAGRLPLDGEQFCGDPHVAMPTHLVVQPREQFVDWLHR